MPRVIRIPKGHTINRGLSIEVVHPDDAEDKFQACSDLFCANGKRKYAPSFCRFWTNVGVLFIARIEEEIIGALTTEIWGATDSAILNQHLPDDKQLSTDPPMLSLLDVCVREDHRRRGVASSLIRQAMGGCFWNKDSLYSRIIATSRVPTNGGETTGTSYSLLRRLDFIEIGRLPHWYYDDDPDENSFICPTCGVPCSCEARLMIWERPEND